jgi:glycosyltransferase involved in cell wall biosynthesis
VESYIKTAATWSAVVGPLAKGDKIAVLTHALPPGGAERQWCYLARGLHQAGFDVTFVVTENLHGPNAHYLPLLQERSIRVCEIGGPPFSEVAVNLPWDTAALEILYSSGTPFPVTFPLLISALKTIGPKAVFAQLDSINLMAGVAAHLADVPCTVLSFRNYNPTNFPYLNNDWFQPLYRILAKSNRVLFSGNSHAGNADYAQWIGVPPDDVRFIPNALDAHTFNPPGDKELDFLRDQLGIMRGNRVVLGVFRLSEEKRPLDFIETCMHVSRGISGIKVLLVGVGPMRGTVEEGIAAKGLQNVVKLLGRREDVSALMRLSSLLLLTSSHEGMPNVVMEAQLIGLPVVATDTGGTADLIVDHVTGYLCKVGDVECLAERCCDILRNPENAFALTKVARQRLLQQFSVDELAGRHLQLIAEFFRDTQKKSTLSRAVRSRTVASGSEEERI